MVKVSFSWHANIDESFEAISRGWWIVIFSLQHYGRSHKVIKIVEFVIENLSVKHVLVLEDLGKSFRVSKILKSKCTFIDSYCKEIVDLYSIFSTWLLKIY